MIRALRYARRLAYLHLAYAIYQADHRRLRHARLAAFARGVVAGATRTHTVEHEMDPEFYETQINNAHNRSQ